MAEPQLIHMHAKRAGGGKPTRGGRPERRRAVIAAVGFRHCSCGVVAAAKDRARNASAVAACVGVVGAARPAAAPAIVPMWYK